MYETRRCERKHKLSILRLWIELKKTNNQTNLQKIWNYLEEYLTDILLAGIQTGITEILITCYTASANVATVIGMVGLIFKGIHVSLH